MPIFEFRCPACSHQFEIITSSSEDGSGLACPQCGREGVEKLLSVFSASGTSKPVGGGGCGHSHSGGFS